MAIWQGDFYRRPLKTAQGEPLWELLICDRSFKFTYGDFCPQSEVSADWLRQQLRGLRQQPRQIEVFRPQAYGLFQSACESLGIPVVPRRNTATLHRWLIQRASWYSTLDTYTGEDYSPMALETPPPTPLPEHLWGEQWRFAALSAADLEQRFTNEPIPLLSLPTDLMPKALGLASTTPIPGLVIDAGRQAMPLAQWLHQQGPASLEYRSGGPHGILLEAGLVDRWVLATFDDEAVHQAGCTFTQRKQASQGLHFLLVRPDDTGLTYTGFWLLQ